MTQCPQMRGELDGGKMITASLTDEDVFDYFEMTAAKHIKVTITTNGTVFVPSME